LYKKTTTTRTTSTTTKTTTTTTTKTTTTSTITISTTTTTISTTTTTKWCYWSEGRKNDRYPSAILPLKGNEGRLRCRPVKVKVMKYESMETDNSFLSPLEFQTFSTGSKIIQHFGNFENCCTEF
jgi:hypothetical protein